MDACLKERDVKALRTAAEIAFPELNVWHSVDYPGKETLPIYALPLVYPLPDDAQHAINQLREHMCHDGVAYSHTQAVDRQEHRQGHIWVASIARGEYLPIGQALFLAEKRRADSALGGGFAHRWWLLYAWVSPAYRSQGIFRGSLNHFQLWHPDFMARSETPDLKRALRDYPQHQPKDVSNWLSSV